MATEVAADGDTPGEIVVRGNVVMEGYYNDPDATTPAMGMAGSTLAMPRWFIPTATLRFAID